MVGPSSTIKSWKPSPSTSPVINVLLGVVIGSCWAAWKWPSPVPWPEQRRRLVPGTAAAEEQSHQRLVVRCRDVEDAVLVEIVGR